MGSGGAPSRFFRRDVIAAKLPQSCVNLTLILLLEQTMGRLLVFCALAFGAYLVLLQPAGSGLISTSKGTGSYSGAASGAVSGIKASAGNILR